MSTQSHSLTWQSKKEKIKKTRRILSFGYITTLSSDWFAFWKYHTTISCIISYLLITYSRLALPKKQPKNVPRIPSIVQLVVLYNTCVGGKNAFPALEEGPICGVEWCIIYYFPRWWWRSFFLQNTLNFSTEQKKLYRAGLHGSSFFCDETGA